MLESKCALRATLWGLMIRNEREAGESGKQSLDPNWNANLYALMKNCALFSGGHCGCFSSPVETSVRVLARSHEQL